MDRTPPSEGGDAGSIPAGSTKIFTKQRFYRSVGGRSRISTDRMQACGACDPGSIPGGSTITNRAAPRDAHRSAVLGVLRKGVGARASAPAGLELRLQAAN